MRQRLSSLRAAAVRRRRIAIQATLCIATPLIALVALGHPTSAVMATQGGFAGFYAFDAPLARRARIVAVVGAGLAVATVLGTLVASSPLLVVVVGGLVALVAAFVCVALEVGPPREYFLVFSFLVATGLPPEAGPTLTRGGLVCLGAATALAIALASGRRDPDRPAREAVDAAFAAVSRFVAAVGSEGAREAQHAAVLAVRRALVTARPDTVHAVRAERAETLLEAAQSLVITHSPPLDPAWVAAVRDPERAPAPDALPPLPGDQRLADALAAAREAADAPVTASTERPRRSPVANAGDDSVTRLNPLLAGDVRRTPGTPRAETNAASTPDAEPPRRSLARITAADQIAPWRWSGLLRASAQPYSPAAIAAACNGVAVAAGCAVGTVVGGGHSYWIALSAAAVLQSSNARVTLRRALHRTAGTLVGLLGAAALLAPSPPVGVLVICVVLLQFVTESIIVASYGLAVVCITSLALVLLEIAHPSFGAGLLGARAVDTLLGCAIGLSVGLMLWPRRAAVRLAAAQAKALRTAGAAVAAGLRHAPADDLRGLRREAHVSALVLRAVHRDAIDDAVRRRSSEPDDRWPLTHAIEHLVAVATSLPRREPAPALAEAVEAGTEALAGATEGHHHALPTFALDGFPATERALAHVAELLRERRAVA